MQAPLAYLVEKGGVAPVPRRGRFGLYHFALLLPDRAALGRFAAHVLRLGLRPGMADHAVSEALYLSDPDGLGIEVYADRPRTSWTYRGDELVMTTEPLDIAGLITAGQGDEWRGAPEGTSMGHVHLHVGDLARAEAFYHRALGFDKKVWSYPGALFFSAGGYHHHLGTNIWSRVLRRARTRPGSWSGNSSFRNIGRPTTSRKGCVPVVTLSTMHQMACGRPTPGEPRCMSDRRKVDNRIEIDVYSDFVCPWCFIGRDVCRRTGVIRPLDVETRHHPYPLYPDAPVDGIDLGHPGAAIPTESRANVRTSRSSRTPGRHSARLLQSHSACIRQSMRTRSAA